MLRQHRRLFRHSQTASDVNKRFCFVRICAEISKIFGRIDLL